MRFTPVVIALSSVALLTASAAYSVTPTPLDPRAGDLIAQGDAALGAGQVDHAIDAYEAALAVQPGSTQVLIDLAAASRRQGMQGKALHYYRDALAIDPQSLPAIAGEGAALAEKGAVDKARRNLVRVQSICGADCPETRELTAVIARGPVAHVVSAEPAPGKPPVTSD